MKTQCKPLTYNELGGTEENVRQWPNLPPVSNSAVERISHGGEVEVGVAEELLNQSSTQESIDFVCDDGQDQNDGREVGSRTNETTIDFDQTSFNQSSLQTFPVVLTPPKKTGPEIVKEKEIFFFGTEQDGGIVNRVAKLEEILWNQVKSDKSIQFRISKIEDA